MRIPLPTRRISLDVKPAFLLLAGFLAWVQSEGYLIPFLLFAAVIFGSVLFHELGHALTALAFGVESDIELHGMGGHTVLRGDPALSPFKHGLVILNGCLAGGVLAFLSFHLAIRSESHSYVWFLIYSVNLTWSLFNLAPLYPMDGGLLLVKTLEAWFGLNGAKAGYLISAVFGFCASAFLFQTGRMITVMITASFAFQSVTRWQQFSRLAPEDLDPALREELLAACKLIQEGQMLPGVRRLARLRLRTGRGALYREVIEQLAVCFYVEKRQATARRLMKSIGYEACSYHRPFAQYLAAAGGDHKVAVRLGNEAYLEKPDARVAYNLGCSYAALKEDRQALRWLRTSVKLGIPNAAELLKDDDLAAVRLLPEFEELEWEALALKKKGPPFGGPDPDQATA